MEENEIINELENIDEQRESSNYYLKRSPRKNDSVISSVTQSTHQSGNDRT